MILQHLNQKTMNKVLPSLRNYISYLANFFFHFKIFSRVGCFVTTNIPGALLCYISLSSGLANIDEHHRNPNSNFIIPHLLLHLLLALHAPLHFLWTSFCVFLVWCKKTTWRFIQSAYQEPLEKWLLWQSITYHRWIIDPSRVKTDSTINCMSAYS